MKTIDDKGFTMVEFAVVIFIILLITALSTPLISETLDRFQFTNSMRLLLSTINRAKGEAVNTGFPCSVLFTSDANGRVNYAAFVDNGNGGGIRGNGLRDGAEQLISDGRMPRGVAITAAATTLPTVFFNGANCQIIQFNSLGFALGFQAGVSTIYSGNIQMNTQIRGRAAIRTIQLGLGGNLVILPPPPGSV